MSKMEIASKLKMGVQTNSILKEIRENTDSNYSRRKLITKKRYRESDCEEVYKSRLQAR